MKVYDYPRQRKAIETAFARQHGRNPEVENLVAGIIEAVHDRGDAALVEFAQRFDSVKLTPKSLRINPAVCERAWKKLPRGLKDALEFAARGIEAFHRKQLRKGYVLKRGGATLEQRVRAVEKAGVYVPGGRAAYPSTLLMNAIPAQVAGVRQIIAVTPPVKQNPEDFVPFAAAHMLGLGESMFGVGGAQAVAALAYGTKSIPRVDVVVGPGNVYVATAKRMLYGIISIDSVAAESEVLVIADTSARPDFIAADLLAQAEHPGDSVIVVGVGPKFDFAAVEKEVVKQIAVTPRREYAESCWKKGGMFIRVNTPEQAAEVADMKAPEHLEIITRNPEKIAKLVSNAGAMFLGPYTPEPVGDYVAGPNHVLPTGGTARFFSPLGVETFLKSSNVLCYDEREFRKAAPHVIALAECEGLFAHADAVKVRLRK